MHTPTPGRNRRWALRGLYVTGPITLLALLAWLTQGVPDEKRDVAMMAYMLVLCVAVGSAVVAAVSQGQMAIARAFTAGYNAALVQAHEAEAQHQPLPPALRLVEQGDNH